MCLGGVSKVPSILMFSPLKAEVPFSKPVLRVTVAVKNNNNKTHTHWDRISTLCIIQGRLRPGGLVHAASPLLNAHWSILERIRLLISTVPSMQVYFYIILFISLVHAAPPSLNARWSILKRILLLISAVPSIQVYFYIILFISSISTINICWSCCILSAYDILWSVLYSLFPCAYT